MLVAHSYARGSDIADQSSILGLWAWHLQLLHQRLSLAMVRLRRNAGRITLIIGGPVARWSGGTCFQMKNVNFRRAAQKTEGQASRLWKMMGRPAEKGSPILQCSLPFCAASQPPENSRFSFGNTALQPARPLFSVILLKAFWPASKPDR